jgi:hypothetical protein
MRLRTLFFIAAFLFLAAGLALRHHPYFQRPISELSVPVLSVTAEEVHTISIQRSGQELLLTQEAGQWLATNGQWSNPIETKRIRTLLQPLQKVNAEGIEAQSLASWQAISGEVPEMVWVRLYSKTTLVESFYLAENYPPDSIKQSFAFLQLPGSEIIYRVPIEVGEPWLQPFNLYREQQLLAFDPATVRGFTIWQDQMIQRFIRKDSLWQDSLGQSLPAQQVQQWLSRLSNLKGEHYADRFNEVEKRPAPFFTLDFHLENEGTIRLEAYADSNRLDLPFVIRSNQFAGRYFRSDSIQLKDLMIQ